MSLPTDEVLSIIKSHLPDPKVVQAIAKDLAAAEKEIKEERQATAGPKAKKRLVVLIRGDSATKAAVEGGAWVVALPEDGNTATLLDNVATAVRASNNALKRNRATRMIRTFARAMEWLKPKAIKGAAEGNPTAVFSIKTKTPIEVVVVEREEIG
jgi:hypothetical protein